jgi:hypothetical protein
MQLLVRKNYGRKQIPEFLAKLSFALSAEVPSACLVSLDETDRVFEECKQSYTLAAEGKIPAFKQVWLSREKSLLEVKLRCFDERVEDCQVYLFPKGFEYCGAVRLSLKLALGKIFELLTADGDSVQLATESNSSGLMLDTYEEYLDTGCEDVYELVVWGQDWLTAAREC